MQPIARVNPKYFAAISQFIAVKDVRYYLEGIFIEPHPVKGVVLVATDGASLALIHDPDGWVKEPIIVGGLSKGLISACAAKGSEKRMTVPAQLYISQHGAVVSSDEAAHTEVNPFDVYSLHMSKIDIVDGKFPNYRRVIELRREAGHAFPCVNTQYLARLDAVAKLLIPGNKYGWGVELQSTGRTTSVLARFTQCDLEQRFLALVMPMRSYVQLKNPLPDWLMPEEAPAATEPATA